jgi:hypothetical protein
METAPRWCFLSNASFYLADKEVVADDAHSSLDHTSVAAEPFKSHFTVRNGAVNIWLPRNSARQRAALRNFQVNSSAAGGSSSATCPPVVGFVTQHQKHGYGSRSGSSLRSWRFSQVLSISR